MYDYTLHKQIQTALHNNNINGSKEALFYARFLSNAPIIRALYNQIYSGHAKGQPLFEQLLDTIAKAYQSRSQHLRQKDLEKQEKGNWFLSNHLAGMSLYVDRFCGDIKTLASKLNYFNDLGVNVLHLMPLFESPEKESDGGYAVSNFRKVDARFGTLADLRQLQQSMAENAMCLMIDIVLNHTSHKHKWAMKAIAGDPDYQDYFYMYADRDLPDQFEKTMPEIFPESSPGNFTYIPEINKWVMTVFHRYQWDLNYSNPAVFIAMLDTIFFYANLGVDILRIDAPAFIWKQLGTTSQNLPQAHTLLQLIKQCVQVATPGLALLGEAIVSPTAIMQYFGTGIFKAQECDFAYNATQMALQWDALATGDTRIMLAAQTILQQKPFGTSWITYTRCHDDIGLGYDDYMIEQAGFNAYQHRQFLNRYYTGYEYGSPAKGALFSYNPKNGDARISGSLASLCGLEKAVNDRDENQVATSIKKILLMQAQSFFIGGLPMLFYGDEVGYTNDYSYLRDEGKAYDNRWMHRPVIDWKKNNRLATEGSIEKQIFTGTKKLLAIRKRLDMLADHSNTQWVPPHNIHVAAFVRSMGNKRLYCVFNFGNKPSYLTWYAFKQNGFAAKTLFDHWSDKRYTVGEDYEFLKIAAYGFCVLEEVSE